MASEYYKLLYSLYKVRYVTIFKYGPISKQTRENKTHDHIFIGVAITSKKLGFSLVIFFFTRDLLWVRKPATKICQKGIQNKIKDFLCMDW